MHGTPHDQHTFAYLLLCRLKLSSGRGKGLGKKGVLDSFFLLRRVQSLFETSLPPRVVPFTTLPGLHNYAPGSQGMLRVQTERPLAGGTERLKQNDKQPEQDAGFAVEQVGVYRVDKTIGQGTYGKVKLGFHVATGEKVIVEKRERESARERLF